MTTATHTVLLALAAAMVLWLLVVLFLYAEAVGAAPVLLLAGRGADHLRARRLARAELCC